MRGQCRKLLLRVLTDTSNAPRIEDLIHMSVLCSVPRDSHIDRRHIPDIIECWLCISWERRAEGRKGFWGRSKHGSWRWRWSRAELLLLLLLLLL